MKILAISNSFGVDGTRYLYGVARAAGDKFKVVTLYIGGCSLYRHYRNMLSEEKAYTLYVDGIDTGFKVSLKDALLSDEWDVVTLQQVSAQAGKEKSYHPFLEELSEYAKKLAPAAKQYMYMTWSYPEGSERIINAGYENRGQMIAAIEKGVTAAAKYINANGIIPALYAMNALYEEKGEETYRDRFHVNLGYARYMLACVWYMALTGKGIEGNTFRDFDVPVSEEDVLLAQKCAEFAIKKNNEG